jgi:[acyl-carrier-protein] S-malonyltransferase
MDKPSGIAYIFPGQGAQTVGMTRDVYDNFASARAVFQLADEATGIALTRLCFEGPEEELRQTINAQPAILTASLACLAAFKEAAGSKILPKPIFMAGHSLGEYTALAAAGVIDYATAIYLARQRGILMEKAGQLKPGGMMAVLGLDENILNGVCQKSGTVIANINCPGQYVISGGMENLNQASELIKGLGAARVRPLQVSGAFHSPLMQPAAEGLLEVITKIGFNVPTIPIIGNTTAQPLRTTEQLKTELSNQLCSSVLWQRSVECMISNGTTTFCEIGPGKVLTGLVKRINANANLVNINDVASLQEAVTGGAH